jgi:hypothetical protein
MPAACSWRPIRAVDEPGASSTKVSRSGPNGDDATQAAAPAAKSKTKKAASRIAAAPELFFFLLTRLRRIIPWLLTLLLLRRYISVPGFSTFDCIGHDSPDSSNFVLPRALSW